MKTRTIHEMAAQLFSLKKAVILTHIRPDGDTIGSAAALCRALRSRGTKAWVLENPQITPKYAPYLDGLCIAAVPEDATLVAVDVAAENMLPQNARTLADRIELAVDHHGSNTGYAAAALVQPERAACGEIIYDLLQTADIAIDKDMAEALYVAVSTDTGCFRYSNVTEHTFLVTAALLRCGAQIYPINQKLFEEKRYARLRLEAHLTQTCRLYAGGCIGVCSIPAAVWNEFGLAEDDVDDISGYARKIEGVQIAVMLRDIENDTVKVSLRTAPGYDASAICARLGGGGHAAAAGASLQTTMEQAHEQVLQAIYACYPALA